MAQLTQQYMYSFSHWVSISSYAKSWARMHDDRLPHGDPGATTVSTPPDNLGGDMAIGPIYFNEAVTGMRVVGYS